jgi:hypothetical protein
VVFQVIKTFFHGILGAVYLECLKGVLDIVGQKNIKPGIAVAVILNGFIVEEHAASPGRGFLDDKEGCVGLFMAFDEQALLELFLVVQKL